MKTNDPDRRECRHIRSRIAEWALCKLRRQAETRWTITTGLVSFIGEHGIDGPAVMAADVVSIIPMVVLFLLLEPVLVSGLTAGSQR